MKLLLYCTKVKPYLVDERKIRYHNFVLGDRSVLKSNEKDLVLNGKIVAECDFEVEEIRYDWYPRNIVPSWDKYFTYYRTNKIEPKEFYEKSCLNWEQLNQYLNDYDSQKFEGGYAIHIKNLHIFDEPRELSEYITKQCPYGKCSTCAYSTMGFDCATIETPITKAPQNMMYAFDNKGNKYIVISIQSQWMCLILNRIKDVEVRRIVLKEMRD